ncbi:MAG TPA: PaaI family thioesterase [Solirubrobacteraceae bacterium]|nr:PaaI family thioesterase [Solirubrobacteraceae bacterium]
MTAPPPPAADLLSMMPLAELLGIELLEAAPEEVRGALAYRPALCTAGGVLHGGTLMAFADTIGALCAFLNLPEGAGTATISSATNMLRAVRGGAVLASSRPLHVGRSVIVAQTDLRDEGERLVAQVTQTQAVLAGS